MTEKDAKTAPFYFLNINHILMKFLYIKIMKKIILILLVTAVYLSAANLAVAKDTHGANGQPIVEYETEFVNGQKVIRQRISGGEWIVISSTPIGGSAVPPNLAQPITVATDPALTSRLAGRILLQVETNGQAWYLEPVIKVRLFLGRPADAFNVMRQRGLGISNKDLNAIAIAGGNGAIGNLAKRLAGRIVLQVEDKGQAWYIDPVSLKRHSLGRPADAFQAMRKLGLGISDADILKIAVK